MNFPQFGLPRLQCVAIGTRSFVMAQESYSRIAPVRQGCQPGFQLSQSHAGQRLRWPRIKSQTFISRLDRQARRPLDLFIQKPALWVIRRASLQA
jgi:hypothetical protein